MKCHLMVVVIVFQWIIWRKKVLNKVKIVKYPKFSKSNFLKKNIQVVLSRNWLVARVMTLFFVISKSVQHIGCVIINCLKLSNRQVKTIYYVTFSTENYILKLFNSLTSKMSIMSIHQVFLNVWYIVEEITLV